MSCLTTYNLPWFVDLTNIPGFYAILLFTASDLLPITHHIHNWMLFLLWLHPFILSGVISPVVSSSTLGTYWPGKFIFQCPIFLPFHTVHRVLKARILKWFTIRFSRGPHSVRPLHHDPSVLGGPIRAWLSFTELDKAVVHVIRLASFLWLWFQSVCPLMPSISAYHLTWVSLTLDVGYLFMVVPAKHSLCSLPWMLSTSSQPLLLTLDMGYPLPDTAPDLECGVSPFSHHSWPWTWGSSSWPPLLTLEVGYLLHTHTETKLHPKANKFQSKTYQANSPTTQEHNPEHSNTGSQKSHQIHRCPKTHYWTLHCTPERRDPAPPTRTPMQASLTNKLWQATHPPLLKGGISTIKRNHKLPTYRKATPNTAI